MQTMAIDEVYKAVTSGKGSGVCDAALSPETANVTTSFEEGSSVQLVGMPQDSLLNGKVGTVTRDLCTESKSEFAVQLDKGHPPILVEKKHLRIAESIAPAPAATKVAHVKKDSEELQVMPAADFQQPIVQPVLLTAVARQSAALRDLDAKVQTLSDTVMTVARNNVQLSPQTQAATQIIYSQAPPVQGTSVGDSALLALENRMTVRTTALEQEMRALRETILQCLPLCGGNTASPQHRQLGAPLVGNSQVLN